MSLCDDSFPFHVFVDGDYRCACGGISRDEVALLQPAGTLSYRYPSKVGTMSGLTSREVAETSQGAGTGLASSPGGAPRAEQEEQMQTIDCTPGPKEIENIVRYLRAMSKEGPKQFSNASKIMREGWPQLTPLQARLVLDGSKTLAEMLAVGK